MRIDFLLIMDYVAYEIADTHIRLLTDLFEEQYIANIAGPYSLSLAKERSPYLAFRPSDHSLCEGSAAIKAAFLAEQLLLLDNSDWLTVQSGMLACVARLRRRMASM